MFKKFFFLLSFSLILSTSSTLSQKKVPDEESEKPQAEESKPVEKPTKRESETKPSENSSKNNSSPSRNENSSKNEDSNSGREKPPKKNPEVSQPSNYSRMKTKNNEDEPKDEPVENPENPQNNQRPPQNERPSQNERGSRGNNSNEKNNGGNERNKDRENQGKRGDDKDDKDDKNQDKNRKRNRGYGGWDPNVNNQQTVVYTPLPSYFGQNDVAFRQFQSYIDSVPNNYLPYFNRQLGVNYQPLWRTDFAEINVGDYPFQAYGWAFYYEPDLDDVFIDFSRFVNVKFEKLILIPRNGETIKKVAKKFKNVVNSPVLAEDISNLSMDRAYNFNIHETPKGDYDLILLNKFGDTVKVSITIK